MAAQGHALAEDRAYAAQGAPEALPRPSFELIEGEGYDREARGALDPSWKRAFLGFLVALVVFSGLAIARVQLTVSCVEALSENAQLQADVAEAREQVQSLAVESSTLSSFERIERIATQNLGMVYVGTGAALAGPEEG